jgi:peptide/nickel transport system ATP-binding protein
MATAPVLSVRDLEISYRVAAGPLQAVRGVSFDLQPNQCLALIGESGCGKSTLGLGLLRLLPATATVTGEIRYRKRDSAVADIVDMGSEDLRRYRWQECAMVFQGALNSLNPVMRVWDHLVDTAAAHRAMSRARVRKRGEELLRMVRLDPSRVMNAYPHELSGGMRQRVLIAMSLLLDPQVLILDEPTTALDVLTQRAIIDVLRSLREQLDFSMIFISHDLGMAAELADDVATMYAGRLIEVGGVRDVFRNPRHPYTVSLLKAAPPITGDAVDLASIPGAPPSLVELPGGCPFHPRCPYVRAERCRDEEPPLLALNGTGHTAACHWWREVRVDG